VTQVVKEISLDVHLLVVLLSISKYRKIFAFYALQRTLVAILEGVEFVRRKFSKVYISSDSVLCPTNSLYITRRKEAKSLLLPSIGLATTK